MASLSFLRGMAARCVHNSLAIGGRIPNLRAEKCKFQRTRPRAASLAALRQFTFCRWNLRLKFICRRTRRPGQPLAALLRYGCRVPLAGKKSATLCAVRGAGSLFSARRAENAAGARRKLVRRFLVRRACSLPEAANAAREGFCLFAAGGGKCGGKNYS